MINIVSVIPWHMGTNLLDKSAVFVEFKTVFVIPGETNTVPIISALLPSHLQTVDVVSVRLA